MNDPLHLPPFPAIQGPKAVDTEPRTEGWLHQHRTAQAKFSLAINQGVDFFYTPAFPSLLRFDGKYYMSF